VFHPRLILCPTDFTENSAFALRIASDLARQYHAALLVLHVADTLGPEHLSFGEATTRLQPETHVADLQRQLQLFAPPQPDLEVRHLLRDGDPARVIGQVVGEEHCDLVVLGTHGRTGLEHLFMGSNAERIIRHCPCPVMVVKYPKPGV
jgi:nucleotide-binding universal stress UspA family protein